MFKKGSLDVEDAQRGLEIFDSIPLQYVNVDMANVLIYRVPGERIRIRRVLNWTALCGIQRPY